LPLRFKEGLFESLHYSQSYIPELSAIAVEGVRENDSFLMFRWLFRHNRQAWNEIRPGVLRTLERKGRSTLLIQIFIEEKEVEILFAYLQNKAEVSTYNTFLKKLILLSEKRTKRLYQLWIDEYLHEHYGKAAKTFLKQNLIAIGKVDFRLKESLERYIKKSFSKRPTLK